MLVRQAVCHQRSPAPRLLAHVVYSMTLGAKFKFQWSLQIAISRKGCIDARRETKFAIRPAAAALESIG